MDNPIFIKIHPMQHITDQNGVTRMTSVSSRLISIDKIRSIEYYNEAETAILYLDHDMINISRKDYEKLEKYYTYIEGFDDLQADPE